MLNESIIIKEKIHKKSIYYIDDEDIINLGFDPKSITSEEFEYICTSVAESIDSIFQDELKNAIEEHAENPRPNNKK